MSADFRIGEAFAERLKHCYTPPRVLLTPHQAKYYSFDLAPPCGYGMDRLSMSLFDAWVQVNPHQIEAALFALQSPLSEGVILADEVGLGKTIEAGIVLCRILGRKKAADFVICPASLFVSNGLWS